MAEESPSDEELVARWRQRDESAVRVLTTRYNRRLFRLARGIVRNDAEAEDVVQEAYVRAFTGIDGFRGESSFGTWLSRIAMNDALGRLRKRRDTVDWNSGGDEIQAHILHMPAASTRLDPEQQMGHDQIRSLLERAIDDLPESFRTVFVLRIVEGLSIEETADVLSLRQETVKTRVHRARTKLRAALIDQIGPVLSEAFPFDGARCDRMTAAVIRRLSVN